MEVKTIGIASDHAGFALKQFVKQYLDEKGMAYKDYGTYTEESCDYSDFGHALAEGIERGEVYPGIAICGSGEGISMTLNKHQSIRAGLAWIPERPLHQRGDRTRHHGRVFCHRLRGWTPPAPHRQNTREVNARPADRQVYSLDKEIRNYQPLRGLFLLPRHRVFFRHRDKEAAEPPVQGSRFKVQGLRFKGSKFKGSRFKVQGSRFKV